MNRRSMFAGALGLVLAGAGIGWTALTPDADAQVRVQQYAECYTILIHTFSGAGAESRFPDRGPIQPTPIPQGWTVIGAVDGPGVVVCR